MEWNELAMLEIIFGISTEFDNQLSKSFDVRMAVKLQVRILFFVWSHIFAFEFYAW